MVLIGFKSIYRYAILNTKRAEIYPHIINITSIPQIGNQDRWYPPSVRHGSKGDLSLYGLALLSLLKSPFVIKPLELSDHKFNSLNLLAGSIVELPNQFT